MTTRSQGANESKEQCRLRVWEECKGLWKSDAGLRVTWRAKARSRNRLNKSVPVHSQSDANLSTSLQISCLTEEPDQHQRYLICIW